MASLNKLYPAIQDKIQRLEKNSGTILNERLMMLESLAQYLKNKQDQALNTQLNFICTHNSRRSIISQIWAYTAAHFYGLANFTSFSGGTAVTAFNPRAVAAIERAGFKVDNPGGSNPHYNIYISEDIAPLTCFSKVYDDQANPTAAFAALMNCSQADMDCPFIPGAEFRLSLSYEDPKAFDDTPEEAKAYDDKIDEIGTQLLFAFSRVNK